MNIIFLNPLLPFSSMGCCNIRVLRMTTYLPITGRKPIYRCIYIHGIVRCDRFLLLFLILNSVAFLELLLFSPGSSGLGISLYSTRTQTCSAGSFFLSLAILKSFLVRTQRPVFISDLALSESKAVQFLNYSILVLSSLRYTAARAYDIDVLSKTMELGSKTSMGCEELRDPIIREDSLSFQRPFLACPPTLISLVRYILPNNRFPLSRIVVFGQAC